MSGVPTPDRTGCLAPSESRISPLKPLEEPGGSAGESVTGGPCVLKKSLLWPPGGGRLVSQLLWIGTLEISGLVVHEHTYKSEDKAMACFVMWQEKSLDFLYFKKTKNKLSLDIWGKFLILQ